MAFGLSSFFAFESVISRFLHLPEAVVVVGVVGVVVIGRAVPQRLLALGSEGGGRWNGEAARFVWDLARRGPFTTLFIQTGLLKMNDKTTDVVFYCVYWGGFGVGLVV